MILETAAEDPPNDLRLLGYGLYRAADDIPVAILMKAILHFH